MTLQLVFEQGLNGVQLGLMLFLLSAGLTLVLGILNTLNLTHGSFYMLGAYAGATLYPAVGSFLLACALAIGVVMLCAGVVEYLVIRRLYDRDHLDQVLATFGLLLFLAEMATVIWGSGAMQMAKPELLAGSMEVLPGVPYPAYRFAITSAGLLVAVILYFTIAYTRVGMMIRAGASNRAMLSALGINVRWLFLGVFCCGAGLAALAGYMVAPLVSIDAGMGDNVLVLCFVVIAIGGLGSVRGAFIASLLIGIVDTFGRMLLPMAFGFPLGPALASMCIYILMAAILISKPEGLFPART